jgi:hypothetical protein
VGTEKPYPSLDDQILACIEAARISDEAAKMEDFQLRVVANDLVLFNLKTGNSFVLYDVDNDPIETQQAFTLPATAQSSPEAQGSSVAQSGYGRLSARPPDLVDCRRFAASL